MEIKISRSFDFKSNTHFIRVDMYKTHEAFLFPEDHPDGVWNCCCAMDFDDPLNPNQFDIVNRLLSVIETSVNELINVASK